MTKINDIWEDIQDKVKKGGRTGVVKRLYEPDSGLYINLGIFTENNIHFLAFEVREESVSNYKCLPHIKGLAVNKMSLGDEKKGSVSLVLSASSAVYNQSFDVLSEDLIEYIKKQSEAVLISLLADRLGLWKKFFSEIPCEILSNEKQIGLAGELYFMDKLLAAGANISLVVNSWKGYEHSSKDYIFPNKIATEVKTSKSKRSVKISSEDQLDETEFDKLFLHYSSISYSNEGEYSLNILVDRIKEQISLIHDAKIVYEGGLLLYGYLEIHKEHYNRLFDLKNTSLFLVKGSFPRIRKMELREGISSTKYVVDLTMATEFECECSEIIDFLLTDGVDNGN